VRTYRYKVQTSTFALFLGIGAEISRSICPPTTGHRVSTRVWLDASRITDAFRRRPVHLNESELDWLRAGLRKVADGIELAEPIGHVLIAVRALEIAEADYDPVALAPALAGWAAAEFGLAPHRIRITRDANANHYQLDWDE
jgi:hypothetical protein